MDDARERRRLEVHQEVRGAAVALTTERGFHGVTVEEIAAATSVSASTIYRHFGTKEALVLTPGRPSAIVRRVADDTKRDDAAAVRRAVNRVYGKDPAAADELALTVDNPGLAEQVRRELADVADDLAAALVGRSGGDTVTLGDRARAAALVAAITVALLDWARRPSDKLGRTLDEVLAAVGASSS